MLLDAHDDFLKKDIKTYYDIRSLYLHTGKTIQVQNPSSNLIYNITKNGKLKTFNKETTLDVKILPSFLWLKKLISYTITNFFRYLWNNKEKKSDVDLYSETDKLPRGVLQISASREIPLGTAVFGEDIERKPQYIDLLSKEKQLDELIEKKQYDEILEEYSEVCKDLKEKEDKIKLSDCYTKIAWIYSKKNEIEKALENTERSFNINKEYNEQRPDLLSRDHYNYASYYCLLGKYDECLDNLEKAISFEERYIEVARDDPAFKEIRSNKKFKALLEINSS